MSAANVLRFVSVPVLVALGACGFGSEVREPVHQALQTGTAPAVRVDNGAGSIRIQAWDRPTVDVKATKSANSSDALRAMKVDVRAQAGGVTIATQYTGALQEGGVSYEIMVPAGASLDIRNGAGSVRVKGVRGNVAVTTQAGSVEADLGKVAGTRSVVLTATTGEVRLSMDSGSSAHVQARSTVGSFTSDFSSVSGSRDNVVGSSADGNVGAGAATVRLTTTTGSIKLTRSGG
jgi:hypothetical protein